MYFASRLQAGRTLASKLAPKYQDQKCAIVALNDGGVMVGTQIAMQLRCVLTLLMSAEIKLPREPTALAGITADGEMAYNQRYSQGEIDELTSEYYNYVEQEKRQQLHQLHQLVGESGTINRDLLRDHHVIVVSDGLSSGFQVDLVYEFLKPIAIQKLIFAVPFASIQAVDKIHVLADEICCLSVLEDYQDTNHYYDKQDVPDHETVLKTIERLVTNW